MAFVPLNSRMLNYLANDDPVLKRYFHGTHPADQLPHLPLNRVRRAYIVNTDPAGEPGEHWLALWTQGDVCQVFDSYGLNQDTLQALESQTCGHYALMYLKSSARG